MDVYVLSEIAPDNSSDILNVYTTLEAAQRAQPRETTWVRKPSEPSWWRRGKAIPVSSRPIRSMDRRV